mgnify:CR=1 FL=1
MAFVDSLLKSDPSLLLLRTPSALFVIPFLYEVFRKNNLATIPSEDLETKLSSFLQENLEAQKILGKEFDSESNEEKLKENADYKAKARKYITLWCSEEKEYIRRYYNAKNIPVVELSPSLERLFSFLEEIEPKKFVGTESRFRTILFQLRELYQNINEDPETRISELKKQRKKIDDEIKQIQETGTVKTYTNVQVQERIDEIVRNSRSLLGEFRQVEENFRIILQEIYKKQSALEATKGSILGYTLDTDSKMRESAQGQSFSSFWNFIAQDTENEIANLSRSITQAVKTDSSDFLLYLKRNLYNSGQKIIEQNRILTERINRILRQENANERQQIKELTGEIKNLARSYFEKFSDEKTSLSEKAMTVQTKPNVFFPQARKVVLPEKNSEFKEISSFSSDNTEISDFTELFNQFYIDEKELYSHISEFKSKNGSSQFTLKELVSSFPIQKGLSELIAYFEIANKEKYISVDSEKQDEISYQKDDRTVTVKVPRMVFL